MPVIRTENIMLINLYSALPALAVSALFVALIWFSS